jgi:hypothetical protein
MTSMDDTTPPRVRRFHLTPGHCLLALLVVEFLLFVVDWLRWLPKGYAVLIAVAAVGVAVLAMFVWFGVAVVFRRRFQFSLRSLLVLTVVVALPCSWFAWEMKEAKKQAETIDKIEPVWGTTYRISQGSLGPAWLRGLLGDEFFWDPTELSFSLQNLADNAVFRNDRFTDAEMQRLQAFQGSTRIRTLDLFGTRVTDAGLVYLAGMTRLQSLNLMFTDVTDAGLVHLEGLTSLNQLLLQDTQATDAGVAKLQQALPNCKITR